MSDTFLQITQRIKQIVARNRGDVSLAALRREVQVPEARLYEALGWLVREGSVTLDASRGVVRAGHGEAAPGPLD